MEVACVPKVLVMSDLREGRLIALSPSWGLMAVGIYAVWPNNVASDGLPIRFVRFMAQKMADAYICALESVQGQARTYYAHAPTSASVG